MVGCEIGFGLGGFGGVLDESVEAGLSFSVFLILVVGSWFWGDAVMMEECCR